MYQTKILEHYIHKLVKHQWWLRWFNLQYLWNYHTFTIRKPKVSIKASITFGTCDKCRFTGTISKIVAGLINWSIGITSANYIEQISITKSNINWLFGLPWQFGYPKKLGWHLSHKGCPWYPVLHLSHLFPSMLGLQIQMPSSLQSSPLDPLTWHWHGWQVGKSKKLSLQWSQVIPSMFGLQLHCPVELPQPIPMEPLTLHPQAKSSVIFEKCEHF